MKNNECAEQHNKLLIRKEHSAAKLSALFGFDPSWSAFHASTQLAPAKKGGVLMPDIRRMGDDFVIVICGELIRCNSYDAAYSLWEEAR